MKQNYALVGLHTTQNLRLHPIHSIVLLRTCLLVKALNFILFTTILTQQALVLPPQIIHYPVWLAYSTQQVLPPQIIHYPAYFTQQVLPQIIHSPEGLAYLTQQVSPQIIHYPAYSTQQVLPQIIHHPVGLA